MGPRDEEPHARRRARGRAERGAAADDLTDVLALVREARRGEQRPHGVSGHLLDLGDVARHLVRRQAGRVGAQLRDAAERVRGQRSEPFHHCRLHGVRVGEQVVTRDGGGDGGGVRGGHAKGRVPGVDGCRDERGALAHVRHALDSRVQCPVACGDHVPCDEAERVRAGVSRAPPELVWDLGGKAAANLRLGFKLAGDEHHGVHWADPFMAWAKRGECSLDWHPPRCGRGVRRRTPGGRRAHVARWADRSYLSSFRAFFPRT